MNLVEKILDNINLRKRQYYKGAQCVEAIIKNANLPNNKTGFEIAKTIVLEQDGLTFLKIIKKVGSTFFFVILLSISAFALYIINNIFSELSDIKELIIIWSLFLLIENINMVVKINIQEYDGIEIKLLKSMNYEQYVYILSEFKDSDHDKNDK